MRLSRRLRNASRPWLEGPRMKLCVVIPAHNERENIEPTVQELRRCLVSESVTHEILIINDHSTDGTEAVLVRLCNRFPSIRYLNNPYSPGFGLAVRCGLENFTGDAVALYMADASDRPEDLVTFFRTMMIEGVDWVFGSRFSKGGRVVWCPLPRLLCKPRGNQLGRVVVRVSDGGGWN